MENLVLIDTVGQRKAPEGGREFAPV